MIFLCYKSDLLNLFDPDRDAVLDGLERLGGVGHLLTVLGRLDGVKVVRLTRLQGHLQGGVITYFFTYKVSGSTSIQLLYATTHQKLSAVRILQYLHFL